MRCKRSRSSRSPKKIFSFGRLSAASPLCARSLVAAAAAAASATTAAARAAVLSTVGRLAHQPTGNDDDGHRCHDGGDRMCAAQLRQRALAVAAAAIAAAATPALAFLAAAAGCVRDCAFLFFFSARCHCSSLATRRSLLVTRRTANSSYSFQSVRGVPTPIDVSRRSPFALDDEPPPPLLHAELPCCTTSAVATDELATNTIATADTFDPPPLLELQVASKSPPPLAIGVVNTTGFAPYSEHRPSAFNRPRLRTPIEASMPIASVNRLGATRRRSSPPPASTHKRDSIGGSGGGDADDDDRGLPKMPKLEPMRISDESSSAAAQVPNIDEDAQPVASRTQTPLHEAYKTALIVSTQCCSMTVADASAAVTATTTANVADDDNDESTMLVSSSSGVSSADSSLLAEIEQLRSSPRVAIAALTLEHSPKEATEARTPPSAACRRMQSAAKWPSMSRSPSPPSFDAQRNLKTLRPRPQRRSAPVYSTCRSSAQSSKRQDANATLKRGAEIVVRRQSAPTSTRSAATTTTTTTIKSLHGRGRRRARNIIRSVWRPEPDGDGVEPHEEEIRLSHELAPQRRRCFNAIRHTRERDEVIRVRDCVRVRSAEGNEYVGKVIKIFLDNSTGSIFANILWYYSKSQVADDVAASLHDRELLASKHTDVVNCDTIEERAYVLSYAEWCR